MSSEISGETGEESILQSDLLSTATCEAVSDRWRETPLRERVDHLRRLRHVIVRRQERIAESIALDTGKPHAEIIVQEILAALEIFRHAERHMPRQLRTRRFRYFRPGFWSKTGTIHHDPLGTVAVIGPSNFPFALLAMQAGLATLCGNVAILKPSERCPRTAGLLLDLFNEARFPAGVVQVVEGGPEAARAIIALPHVSKVFFIGSTAAGQQVADLCGKHFKPCVLELGGSGAAIVCADANIGYSVRGIVWSALYSGANSCVGTRRVYVSATVMPEFLHRLHMEMRSLKPSDLFDPRAARHAYEDDVAALDVAGEVGASLATRVIIHTSDGERRALSAWEAGRAEARSGSPGHEISSAGTLVAVHEVESVEEAVHEVNRSSFGLSASVWSRSPKRAREIAGRLDVGIVWINDASIGQPQFSWVGRRLSGWGAAHTLYAVREMTSPKTISYARGMVSGRKIWWYPYSREKGRLFMDTNRLAYGPSRIAAAGPFLASAWRYMRARNESSD